MGKIKRLLAILWAATKIMFVAFVFFLSYLFWRPVSVPKILTEAIIDKIVPENIVVRLKSMSFGFIDGLKISSLTVFHKSRLKSDVPVLSADEVVFQPFQRVIYFRNLIASRLHDGYYEEGNKEKNEAVDFNLPQFSRHLLILDNPNILSVNPSNVVADVYSKDNRLTVDRARIVWADSDVKSSLDASCYLDFNMQEIYGEVSGEVKQHHIRPLIETIEINSALPYIDAFTEVKGNIPSFCSWKVNLINNDFDMQLEHHPVLGKYNNVEMARADGKINLHVYTRGDYLNYSHVFGPIIAVGPKGENLSGTVFVEGSNGVNTVSIEAESLLPLVDLLKIGGCAGDVVSREIVGETKCNMTFTFPRAESGNLAHLDGKGSVSISNGQIMRMKGFTGLVEMLADKLPGFSVLTDSTAASCTYTIEKGVVKTDDFFIEGSVFSVKMTGSFDSVSDKLDFVVRVQFMKKDSLAGKILNSIAWPFAKLLLEYRLTGSIDKPEWHYISVIDRIAVGGEK